MTEERPWTLEEAAEWLQRDPETVRRWARSGKLKGKKLGREWRFNADDVRAQVGGASVVVSQGAAVVEAQMNAAYTRMMRGRTA